MRYPRISKLVVMLAMQVRRCAKSNTLPTSGTLNTSLSLASTSQGFHGEVIYGVRGHCISYYIYQGTGNVVHYPTHYCLGQLKETVVNT